MIIDDESDQASVNTSNPDKWQQGQKERSAINQLISSLLELLPRGQYVGYTATPFANVFVDPSDAIDVFPRDFILSLDRPPGYMGARDFHDLDENGEPESRNVSTSNELAYVRDIRAHHEDDGLRNAMDTFVLTAMVKLYRAAHGVDDSAYRHHTMLVHESVKQADHKALAEQVRTMWAGAGYYGASGQARLSAILEDDLLPVMRARAGDLPVPDDFAALQPHLGEALQRIEGPSADPVLIVNGDKDASSEEVAFDKRSVWRILIGGTKLARGFTIEGLTVSYYRRTTKQADTLMQMGRWFGFRRGYRDLVRLYIGREEQGGKVKTFDLYEAFEAACLAEELFRDELEKYAVLVDGQPQITPADVPPLVAQHLGWLKPVATNKMYNAELVERRSPGRALEPTGYPDRADAKKRNLEAVRPIVQAAVEDGQFVPSQAATNRRFDARHGVVEHAELVAALSGLRWLPIDHFAADLRWLTGLSEQQVRDWVVVLPQHVGDGPRRDLDGLGTLSVFARQRRRPPLFGALSDPKHRHATARIAGVQTAEGDALAANLHADRRGGVLVYPVYEGDEVPAVVRPEVLNWAVVITAPLSTGPADGNLVRFVVRDPSRADEPIVDAA